MSLIAIESIWEYQTAANTVPPDPAAVTVPTAGWTAGGVAPFGTLGTLLLENPIATAWALGTGLWLRRNVVLSGDAPVLLHGQIENAMYMYFDGEYVGTVNPTNAQITDSREWYVVIPKALATAGTHEVALLCLDEAGGVGVATYVYAEADYMHAMLPTQPQAPAVETLEWLTDLQESKNGTENPLKIRVSPKQGFTYSYPTNALEKARAQNIVQGAAGKKWLVPVWSQAQLKGAVAAGLTTLSAVTAYSEFRTASLALLWQSTDKWQVIGIDTVASGSLKLSTVTEEFTNAWLMPVRFGFLPKGVTKRTNGYNASYELAFEILDNAELTVAAPTQYSGNDLYTEPTLLVGDNLSDDIMTSLDINDPGQGLVSFYSNWLTSHQARTYSAICEGQAEAWELREFLHRRAGRYRPFWQPSFESDLRVTGSGTIVSTMTVKNDEYRQHSTRTHIVIEDASGTWYVRTITGTTVVDSEHITLTLNTALNVAVSDIRRVCWLGLKRLNADSIEIRHIGAGVAQMEVRTVEIAT